MSDLVPDLDMCPQYYSRVEAYSGHVGIDSIDLSFRLIEFNLVAAYF